MQALFGVFCFFCFFPAKEKTVSKPLLRLLSAGSLESKTYSEKYNCIGLLHMATNPSPGCGYLHPGDILDVDTFFAQSL